MLPELDSANVGEALMRIAITSHFLGHKRIVDTVDPYLLSSDEPCSPETQFVIDILHQDPAKVIPEKEMLAYMRLSSAWDPPTPERATEVIASLRSKQTRP